MADSKDKILCFEEPESNLHPNFQAQLANIFMDTVNLADNFNSQYIIETHSEHVVNGLRRAIRESNSLKANDANIYFFNGFDSNQSSKVELIGIDEDGSLSKFPKDFFDQVNQDLSEIIKLRNQKLNG